MQKLDGKFYGRIFREKDNTEVPPDQFIVFLAKDRALIPTLEFYYRECASLGCGELQLMAVSELIERARAWQFEHPEEMKLADVEPGEISTEVKGSQAERIVKAVFPKAKAHPPFESGKNYIWNWDVEPGDGRTGVISDTCPTIADAWQSAADRIPKSA